MPDSGQWMTVREFAAAANITQQRVSQLLHKSLQEFHKTEKGRILVNSDALEIISQNRQKQGYKAKSETVSEILVKELQAELDAVKAERDKLRDDFHALEISAAVSAARLDEVGKHEQEQAQTITALNESLKIAMSLHAGTIRGQLETAAKHSDDDLAKRDAVTVNQADVVKHDAPRPDRQKVHEDETPKRGLLSRLFGRKD